MEKNKILVTGATGFIGRALCQELRKKNYSYIGHDEVGMDVTKPETFNFDGAEKISAVIHLAGKTFVPDSWKYPGEFIQVNTVGTQNIANFCKETHAKLIYVSAYVYGNSPNNPINELHPPDVNNPYALSKFLGEEICIFYQKTFNLPVAIVRPFNVFGPGQNELFLIPEVIRQVKAGVEIKVKDLYPKRDFIYVEDVANLLIKLVESGKSGIFNAATGKSFSVLELIECVQRVAGTNLKVLSENAMRPNEISDTIGDITKAQNELGWNPHYDLEAGIRKYFNS